MLVQWSSRIRERLLPRDSAYAPAGVRLVNPRLPPSRDRWRRIHNQYEMWIAILSLLAVWASAIHAPPPALITVALYSVYTLVGKFLLIRWIGVEHLYSMRLQMGRTFLNLCVAAIVLYVVYSSVPKVDMPQAAGLWLILVLSSLPAAAYLNTGLVLASAAISSVLLLGVTLVTVAQHGDPLPNVVWPLVANVFWLAALLFILRVSLRTLATREQGFEDALTTLTNIGVDQGTVPDLCVEAVKRIARRGLYEYVLIVLHDEESVALGDNALEVVAVEGAPREKLVGYAYPVTSGVTGRAVAERSAQLVNDVDRDTQRRFLSHEALPGVKAECAVPIIWGDRVLGVLDVESTRPNVFGHEDTEVLRIFATQLAPVLAEAQQMEFQASLRQAMQRILAADTTRSMMEQLAELANQVLRADSTVIYLREPGGEAWHGPFWGGNIDDPNHYQRRHIHTDSMLQWLVRCPETVYARDAQHLLRMANQRWEHRDTHDSVFIVREKVHSVAATPLRAGVVPVGVMFVNYQRERKLGRAFRDMAAAFFDVAGIAALNSHLREQSRTAGRQDAVIDLHDGLSQIINYQIRTRLQQLGDSIWLAENSSAHQAVADIERALSTASDLVRRLKDRPDYSQPLSETLAWIAGNVNGTDARVNCHISSALRRNSQKVRGWIAQEVNYILLQAVHNAVEHAQANRIEAEITLTEDGRLKAIVSDDGVGFDQERTPTHRGLYNMRNRAIKLGGSLSIDTSLGRGTRLTLEVPLNILLLP